MPTTVISMDVFGFHCKEHIEKLDFHADDGWKYLCTVRNVSAKISLYQNPRYPKQINFHAFCCGVHKVGYLEFELTQTRQDLTAVADGIGELMQEFRQEAMHDRAEAATQLVQEKRTTHGLNQ